MRVLSAREISFNISSHLNTGFLEVLDCFKLVETPVVPRSGFWVPPPGGAPAARTLNAIRRRPQKLLKAMEQKRLKSFGEAPRPPCGPRVRLEEALEGKGCFPGCSLFVLCFARP